MPVCDSISDLRGRVMSLNRDSGVSRNSVLTSPMRMPGVDGDSSSAGSALDEIGPPLRRRERPSRALYPTLDSCNTCLRSLVRADCPPHPRGMPMYRVHSTHLTKFECWSIKLDLTGGRSRETSGTKA